MNSRDFLCLPGSDSRLSIPCKTTWRCLCHKSQARPAGEHAPGTRAGCGSRAAWPGILNTGIKLENPVSCCFWGAAATALRKEKLGKKVDFLGLFGSRAESKIPFQPRMMLGMTEFGWCTPESWFSSMGATEILANIPCPSAAGAFPASPARPGFIFVPKAGINSLRLPRLHEGPLDSGLCGWKRQGWGRRRRMDGWMDGGRAAEISPAAPIPLARLLTFPSAGMSNRHGKPAGG